MQSTCFEGDMVALKLRTSTALEHECRKGGEHEIAFAASSNMKCVITGIYAIMKKPNV